MIIADLHCDTITRLYHTGENLLENTGQWDIKRLRQIHPAAIQVFAIWLSAEARVEPLKSTLRYLDFYQRQMKAIADVVGHVNGYEEVLENEKRGKLSAFLFLEGGEALEGELANVSIFYQLGVRGMTLTWNQRNALADGVAEEQTGGGLTQFGREVVKEMERLGMVVDVSHLSEAGFWDVAKIAEKPFIASHSNARAICNHRRNLTDEQIKAVAASGGVVGINLYSPFLASAHKAGVSGVIRHIGHMLQTAGEDHVALGCDFDGMDEKDAPEGLSEVSRIPDLIEAIQKNFGAVAAEKIAERNFRRVVKQAIG